MDSLLLLYTKATSDNQRKSGFKIEGSSFISSTKNRKETFQAKQNSNNSKFSILSFINKSDIIEEEEKTTKSKFHSLSVPQTDLKVNQSVA